MPSGFFKTYFQNPEGFNLYMLTWETLNLYPYTLCYNKFFGVTFTSIGAYVGNAQERLFT